MKTRYLVYACILIIVILLSIFIFTNEKYEDLGPYLSALYLIMIGVFIIRNHNRW